MLKLREIKFSLFFKNTIFFLFIILFSIRLDAARYQTVTIQSAGQRHLFNLEIADTAITRQKGLMYRKVLNDEDGMLFVFDQPERLCFWMKNTFVPLDILLLNKQSVIVEILKNMKPHSQKNRCSKGFMQRAIELKAGICHDKGIRVGDTLTFLTNTSAETSE